MNKSDGFGDHSSFRGQQGTTRRRRWCDIRKSDNHCQVISKKRGGEGGGSGGVD